MSQVAKLFTNGRSQAVRLPAAYRFDTKEVFIRQDSETGDVILSRKPANWDDFFVAIKSAEVPPIFWMRRSATKGRRIVTPLRDTASEVVHAGYQYGKPPAQRTSGRD